MSVVSTARRRPGHALLLLAAIFCSALPALAQPTELFISEYVEGSSLNKAVEIYNGTGSSIDLAAGDYELLIYFNGSSSAGTTVDLTGAVADGAVFVVADDGADAAILAQTDQTSTASFFNGDDAVVLVKGGVVVDAIGQIGFDPGSEWGSGNTSTQDNTIRRMSTVCAGDTNPNDAFDPSVEWDGFAQDTFDGLGAHTLGVCGSPPPPPPPPPPADIVINEIHADPDATGGDANGDGTVNTSQDEFVEIVNTSASPVDISGWTLSDGFTVRHTFPAGTILTAGCGVAVFGGGTPTGTFGGGVVQTASTNALGLNNGGDSVTLNDGSSDVASVTYGSEGGDNQSLTRDPDLAGSFVKHSTATGSGGALFSPGTQIDGSNFSGCAAPPPLVVNEIDYDQPGIDAAEFIEILNVSAAPVDLSAYEVVLVNGTGGGAAVYNTIALPAVNLAAGDYFVICGDAANVFGCDLDTTPDTNLIQNGAPDAVAIVQGSTVIDAVSYEGDTGAPYTEGSGAGLEDPGTTGNEFLGIARLPSGADTDQNNVDFGVACITPGSENLLVATNCSAAGPVIEIFAIQGDGLASPFEGLVVTTNDNVVTAVAPNGFFIQTPTARTDGDPDTSDGIFVFTSSAPAVAAGDQVDVTGTVIEFFGFTEFDDDGLVVTVDGPGPGLPPAVTFDAATPSPDPTAPSCTVAGTPDAEASNFECFEGMRVQVTGGTVGQGNQRFNPDPIAEVFVVADSPRAFREPGIEYPGLGGLPVWDGNPEVFELDPDKLGLPNQFINAGSSFDAVGVLGYEFGDYEIWPTSLTLTPAALPQPVPAPADDEVTVATLNLFRLFDDVDDPPSVDAQGNTRNDTVVPTLEYQRRLEKFSRYIREALLAPDILAVQEAEKLGVLEDLAARIMADDASVQYEAVLIEGNDLGTIDVGFLVRTDVVEIVDVTQLGKDEVFDFDGRLLHDRPPLVLEARLLQGIPGLTLRVMALHQRSLSGIEGSEAERVRLKRDAQARSVAQKADSIQALGRLIVTGDFNAFEFTDGYVDVLGQITGTPDPLGALIPVTPLVDPPLANLVLDLPALQRYSFVFRGSAQTLDHSLASEGVDSLVTAVAFGRGNADAPVDLLNDASTALRSSDHDGLVVTLGATAAQLLALMIEQIEDLVDAGGLNAGQGNSLIVKLEQALLKLAAGQNKVATNQLNAFINEAEDYILNGGFDPATVAALELLIAAAEAAIADIDAGEIYAAKSAADTPALETAAAEEKPTAFALAQNYPNPFNPVTRIAYDVPQSQAVTLAVYDMLGREVARLVDGVQSAGRYEVTFEARDLSSGLYLYVLRSGATTLTKTMVVMK